MGRRGFSFSSSHSQDDDDNDVVFYEPEYCAEAISEWIKYGSVKERANINIKDRKGFVKERTMRAKKHLSALGWSFKYVIHCGRRELRYISPRGKQHNSLRIACIESMESSALQRRKTGRKKIMVLKQSDSSKIDRFPKVEVCSTSTSVSELRKPCCSVQQEPKSVPEKVEDCSTSPSVSELGKPCFSVQPEKVEDCSTSTSVVSELRKLYFLVQQEPKSVPEKFLAKVKKGRKTRRFGKSLRQGVATNFSPLTILTWLIANKVVSPREKVYYLSTKGRPPMAEGRLRSGGIKCNCCGKVYTLNGFGFHVSGKYGKSAANIFVEDGRSLLDFQMQILHKDMKNRVAEPLPPAERSNVKRHEDENDDICSVCHYGGDLILCDKCPSSFHRSCLGITDVPDGDWFCPSCRCQICCQNKLREAEHCMDDDGLMKCTQCERKYHLGCLKPKGEDGLDCFSNKNWFCSKRCQEVFAGLHELIGKPIPVGINNLTWTLLKFKYPDDGAFDIENYCKLNVALGIIHECFETVKEPYTKGDILTDVVFSKRSELNRLNFQGFYTVVLQKEDEFITVATVRIYGENVAEIPLVGTRIQYRQLGMCGILMNVLEKKLMELGIQRLVLPAVPSVLKTWTGSFGFSKLTESERYQLLDYTFLDFQDTLMCHKILIKTPSTEVESNSNISNERPTDMMMMMNLDEGTTNAGVAQSMNSGTDKGQVSVRCSNKFIKFYERRRR